MRNIPFMLMAATLSGCVVVPQPVDTPLPVKRSSECSHLGTPLAGWRNFQIPVKAAKYAQSGWVQVRFDIANGKVTHPAVEATSPKGFYEEAGLQWVSQLVYSPETNARGCVLEYRAWLG